MGALGVWVGCIGGVGWVEVGGAPTTKAARPRPASWFTSFDSTMHTQSDVVHTSVRPSTHARCEVHCRCITWSQTVHRRAQLRGGCDRK